MTILGICLVSRRSFQSNDKTTGDLLASIFKESTFSKSSVKEYSSKSPEDVVNANEGSLEFEDHFMSSMAFASILLINLQKGKKGFALVFRSNCINHL